MFKLVPHEVLLVESIPNCNFCDDGTPGPYDFVTTIGPWANGCEKHYKEYRLYADLGMGKGQLYVTKDQLSPNEVKLVEGQMYTVKYKYQAGNNRWYVREFRATFLWEDKYGDAHWSFRPVAGTSSCPKSDILDIRESEPKATPVPPKNIGEYKPENWS